MSDQVSISGDAYFALTPSCVMGGGSLDAEFHSGSLSAWFKARADFLMQWKPFYFLVEIGVDMGVALQTDLLFVQVTLKIELGADLSLWGPPVGGLVQVHLWICTITIGFGPPFGQGNDYLPFNEFHTLLPQDGQKKPRPTTSRAKESAPAPLKNLVKLVINRGLVAQTGTDGRWLVRADEFVFSVKTTFPLTQLDLTGPDGKTTPIPPPPLAQQDKDAPGCARLSDGYYVGVDRWGLTARYPNLLWRSGRAQSLSGSEQRLAVDGNYTGGAGSPVGKGCAQRCHADGGGQDLTGTLCGTARPRAARGRTRWGATDPEAKSERRPG